MDTLLTALLDTLEFVGCWLALAIVVAVPVCIFFAKCDCEDAEPGDEAGNDPVREFTDRPPVRRRPF